MAFIVFLLSNCSYINSHNKQSEHKTSRLHHHKSLDISEKQGCNKTQQMSVLVLCFCGGIAGPRCNEVQHYTPIAVLKE